MGAEGHREGEALPPAPRSRISCSRASRAGRRANLARNIRWQSGGGAEGRFDDTARRPTARAPGRFLAGGGATTDPTGGMDLESGGPGQLGEPDAVRLSRAG